MRRRWHGSRPRFSIRLRPRKLERERKRQRQREIERRDAEADLAMASQRVRGFGIDQNLLPGRCAAVWELVGEIAI